MKRIFTAIDISEEARSKAADYIKNLREEFSQIRVGWERPEKLHLTMKFLGAVDDKQLANLTAAAEETATQFSDFKLQIAETGVFPSKRNARILWLGVQDEEGSLQRLNEMLESECEKKGFAREKRNFKAHLTVGRLRKPHKSKELVERHLENEFTSTEFQVSKIAIYESHLQKSGSIYEAIKNIELKIQT